MRRIGAVSLPPKGSAQREAAEQILAPSLTPARKRELKRRAKEAFYNVVAQTHNGAPLPAPETLREFLQEYSGRAAKHGLHSLPLSFNVGEAFYDYDPRLNAFFLLPEHDQACQLVDLLDIYTSTRITPSLDVAAESMNENEIYSFSFIDSPCFSLTGKDGTFSIRAMNITRRGNQISIILTAGDHQAPKYPALAGSQEINTSPPPVWKEGIRPEPSLKPGEVFLDGQKGVLRALFFSRIDISSGIRERSTYLRDHGNNYIVSTDDAGAYEDVLTGELMMDGESIEKNAAEVRALGTLAEVSTFACYAPWCFQQRHDPAQAEQHPTRLRREWPAIVTQGNDKFVSQKNRRFMRPVYVLPPNRGVVAASVELPRLRVERRGYWKKLAPSAAGTDRNGVATLGKTWVDEIASWTESAPQRVDINTSLPTGKDPGFIYVLRCAAHAPDVFKIGLTRRTVTERARELGGHTGAPDAMLEVISYPVGDCASVEAAVHKQLADYRLKKEREFFHAPLTLILATIVRAVEAMAGSEA